MGLDRRFAEDEVGGEAARWVYGPNHERLVRIKTLYDPTNFFRLNVNIKPKKEGG